MFKGEKNARKLEEQERVRTREQPRIYSSFNYLHWLFFFYSRSVLGLQAMSWVIRQGHLPRYQALNAPMQIEEHDLHSSKAAGKLYARCSNAARRRHHALSRRLLDGRLRLAKFVPIKLVPQPLATLLRPTDSRDMIIIASFGAREEQQGETVGKELGKRRSPDGMQCNATQRGDLSSCVKCFSSRRLQGLGQAPETNRLLQMRWSTLDSSECGGRVGCQPGPKNLAKPSLGRDKATALVVGVEVYTPRSPRSTLRSGMAVACPLDIPVEDVPFLASVGLVSPPENTVGFNVDCRGVHPAEYCWRPVEIDDLYVIELDGGEDVVSHHGLNISLSFRWMLSTIVAIDLLVDNGVLAPVAALSPRCGRRPSPP